ncbi:MAG: hypothetical protein H7246_10315 [Phycisphaerae bacterium]|nr:hypothetical protein [Saprospiraceae bacterium]
MEPEFFEQKRLLQRKRDGKLKVECPGSYEDVEVLELLDGVSLKYLPGWAKDSEWMNGSRPGIIPQIRELIKASETRKALELLQEVNPSAAVILLAKFTDAEKEHHLGKLNFQAYTLTVQEVRAGILALAED